LFVAVRDSDWLGKAVWETPIAKVINGMQIVDKITKVGDMKPVRRRGRGERGRGERDNDQ
jgi:hypothetical protein